MKCHLVLLLVGWFLESHAHPGKHVHVKIVVPVYKHNHHHTHKVYKHLPPQVVVHQHHHHHDHGHKHGHDHKHDHHHDKDHGEHWDVHDWSEHSSFSSSGDSDFHPEAVTEKSLKVESFKDSSVNPVQQHYVTGSYRVQQDGDGTKIFQAPQTGFGGEEDEDLEEYEQPKQQNPYELEPLRQFFQNQNHI